MAHLFRVACISPQEIGQLIHGIKKLQYSNSAFRWVTRKVWEWEKTMVKHFRIKYNEYKTEFNDNLITVNIRLPLTIIRQLWNAEIAKTSA